MPIETNSTKNMRSLGFLLLTICSFSCGKPTLTESKLLGIWNGYQYEYEFEDGQVSVKNEPPFNIAFVYDNGIEILRSGKLKGRIAVDRSDPDTEFKDMPVYRDKWELMDKTQLKLATNLYSILILTKNELTIERSVNSNTMLRIKLKKDR